MTDQTPSDASVLSHTRCGIIAVVGAPNAGKSTLVNKLTGAKVSIVTHKAQTTRQRIMGIYVEDHAQVILADTPGIFAARKNVPLEKAMVKAALDQAGEADAVLLVVDASKKSDGEARDLIERLPKRGKRFLALNKIDQMPREKLLPLASGLQEFGQFDGVFMISALNGSGCAELKKTLTTLVPDGPFLYDEDALTDMPQRLWAAEITREQAFLLLHDEIPYGLHVETDLWEETEKGLHLIQTLIVSNDRHKGMAIGKGGAKIKEIGTRARTTLMTELERPVHLDLQVKTGDAQRLSLALINS